MNWIAKPDEHGRVQRRSLTEFVGRLQRSWTEIDDDGEPVLCFEEPGDGEVVVTLPDEPLPPSTALIVEEDGSTSVVEDHIGSIFYRASDGARVEIDHLGPVPAGLTDQPPPPHSARAAVSFDDGGWTVSEPLAALKADLKAAIDVEAERQRLRYITPGAGQAMTYARKVEQARAAQADAEPEPEDYPLLAASIGIDGGDILAVAATVLAMDAAWEQIGAAIEAARLNGKRAIDLAETVEAARSVEVIWPAVP